MKQILSVWSRCLTGVVVALLAVSAVAGGNTYRQSAGGMEIYFGNVPAELMYDQIIGGPDDQMHGGIPESTSYHLMVSLFDSQTGQRIKDARITATVSGSRDYEITKTMEPMLIAGRSNYGNYFKIPGQGLRRVVLIIRRSPLFEPVSAEFQWGRA